MMVRLAFAVQSAVEPEILIVDEALSVGDVFFQQKCYQRMHALLDRGMCIILASHDLASVQRYCHRTLVFRRGQVEFQGPSTEATMSYFQLEQQEKATAYAAAAKTGPAPAPAKTAENLSELIPDWPADILPPPAGARVIGNGWARCTALALRDAANRPRDIFRQGETLTMFYEFEILQDMEFCVGAVTIRDKTALAVHSKITLQDGVKAPARVRAGTRLRFRQDTVLNLHCADYTLDVSLDMVAASFADQPGIGYDDFMGAQLRICELPSIASFGVRLRPETVPFQLLHFGMAGLPSQSVIQVISADS
jgi:energy-coupling factor transporter ATP-binding protein EcfA2